MKGAKSMSIQTEITRLQGLRNTMRAALVALGLAQSTADLEDCVTAVEGTATRAAAWRPPMCKRLSTSWRGRAEASICL